MVGVLIVDDNPQIRRLLRTELNSDEETQVIGEVEDGLQGFQLSQALRPDVILVDVSMARLDGIETTRRLRSLLPQTVIIDMSRHTRGMVEQALVSAGADAFLPKDTLPEDLLPSIKKALHRRS